MSNKQLITINARQLEYATLALDGIKNGLPRAIQGAINTTLTAAKDTFYQAILKEYALSKIPSNRNGKILNIKRAKPSDLTGNLYFKDRNLPLFKFNVSPRRPAKRNPRQVNVVAEVLRGNPQPWPHAFIAKMKSGRIGVFTRTGKTEMTSKRWWVNKKRNNKDKIKRESITERYSTSIPQMIEQVYIKNPMVQDKIQQQANMKFEEQINKILQKASK